MRNDLKRRWVRSGRGSASERGSAAIEFALIAPIFFLLLFAIIETGLSFFGNMVLLNGTQEAARLIRTGQAQSSDMTQDEFRAALCDQINLLLSCDSSKLTVDIRAFAAFTGAGVPPALDGSGNIGAGLDSYDLGASSAGGGNTIVLVRTFYAWPLHVPLFSQYYANMAGDARLLSASVAFRNEPF